MKILQLIHKPQNRGAETFACQLTHHLLKLGHEVKLVALYDGTAVLPYELPIESLNASVHKKVIDIAAWNRLSQIVKNFVPDIIQANSGDTLKYAVLSKYFFKWNIPIISRNASEVGKYLTSYLQKKLNKFLYNNIDHVISVSYVSKKDITNQFPFLSEKIEVIPVGLEKHSGLDPIGLKPFNKKHIVHVGGFSFEKNHKGLFNILEMVLSREPNIHLHLIGDGPLKDQVLEDVGRRGLLNSITFHGFISNPLPYIKSAKILVLPSTIEGLPGVLLEAMYCRTPVIAYNVGGISEIINSETGTLIKENDEAGFAEAILKNLNKKDNLQVLNAYNIVSQNFMNEQLALNFVKSYKKVIDKEIN